MTDKNSNRFIDLSEAKQPSHYLKQEAEKHDVSDKVRAEQENTYEQAAENKIAHQQNVTAYIPGGSTDADLDK